MLLILVSGPGFRAKEEGAEHLGGIYHNRQG